MNTMRTIYVALTVALLMPATAFAADDIDFTIAEGFQLETVLKEPDVRQPLCLNFDERGRLWVTQYLQFPFPKGLKVIGHDNYWRIQYENFPPPAPPNHEKGLDRVTIYEDTDGDGSFDTHRDFVTGLNIATSALPGRGGVWVLNPPYLLFYADANRDDVPDGDPEVHLAGFGLEDLHAVANGLRWGPDGWLYGYQGSTTTATITRPGMNDEGHHFKGQNLWRYNTRDKRFELYMEGGHNHFGIALDAGGRMFTGSNGGILGFHAIQGGFFWKSWAKHGELTNPYAYGFFNGMEDDSSRPKLSQALVSYEAPQFPKQFQHYIFTARALKRCVSGAELRPKGSTYTSHEMIQLVQTEDQHFRPVGMALGPDGALYIADWHDTNITWSVSAETDRILRETGRVYRVTYGENTPYKPFDMTKASNEELAAYLDHDNKWYRETALRVFYDRNDAKAIPVLDKLLWNNEGRLALNALWALNASGGFTMDRALKALDHINADVRRWAIHLLGNDHKVTPDIQARLVAMADEETHPQVRRQLASTAKRLPVDEGLELTAAMLRANKDADDTFIPLLLWWSVEQHIRNDREAAVDWAATFADAASPLFNSIIVSRLGRRFTQDRDAGDFVACAKLLETFDAPELQREYINGIAAGLGRGTTDAVPQELRDALAALLEKNPNDTQLLIIAARLGDRSVYENAIRIAQDSAAPNAQRVALINLLGQDRIDAAKDPLMRVFRKAEAADIRSAALGALQNFSDEAIGALLLEALPDAGGLKARIAGVIVSRKPWAKALLEAVDKGSIPAGEIDRDLLTNLAALNDPAIDALVRKHWGTIRTSPDEKMAQVNAAWATVKNGPGNARDGIKVYEEACGKCHVHLGVGRKVGPDMTGLNRNDLWDFVTNVIDPSRSVLPEYTGTQFTIAGDDDALGGLDDRIITGFVLRDGDEEIAIVDSAGNELTVAKDRVKEMRPMALSVMPEGLLFGKTDQELRDLFAFIQADEMPEE